jgi:hypothetical protein
MMFLRCDFLLTKWDVQGVNGSMYQVVQEINLSVRSSV